MYGVAYEMTASDGATVVVKVATVKTEEENFPGEIESHFFSTFSSKYIPEFYGSHHLGEQHAIAMAPLRRAVSLNTTEWILLPEKTKKDIVRELLTAVLAFETAGWQHRDLKPDNIFITSIHPVQVSFIDFGSACQGVPKSVRGTPSLMPPEILTTLPDNSYKQDVYSVGALVYRLYFGHHFLEKLPENFFTTVAEAEAIANEKKQINPIFAQKLLEIDTALAETIAKLHRLNQAHKALLDRNEASFLAICDSPEALSNLVGTLPEDMDSDALAQLFHTAISATDTQRIALQIEKETLLPPLLIRQLSGLPNFGILSLQADFQMGVSEPSDTTSLHHWLFMSCILTVHSVIPRLTHWHTLGYKRLRDDRNFLM